MSDTPPADPPAAERPAKEPTRYVICRRLDTEIMEPDGKRRLVSVLFEEDEQFAFNAPAAVKQHVAEQEKQNRQVGRFYVAVPESRWTEVTMSAVRPAPVWEAAIVARRNGAPLAQPEPLDPQDVTS